MWLFYVVACGIAAAGLLLWCYNREIHLVEWLYTAAAGFVIAALFHYFAYLGVTHDEETLSGRIVTARYIPAWVESYYTTSAHKVGKVIVTVRHYHTAHHPENWRKSDSFGRDFGCTRDEYTSLVNAFGNIASVAGCRTTWNSGSHMQSGNPNDQVSSAPAHVVVPVTKWQSFENRVKGAPSTFSFQPLRPDEVKLVYPYPENGNPFSSDRLLGSASVIPIDQWDRLNSIVGPQYKVNIIAIGFSGDRSLSELQKRHWIGGRKNDLVICYGGSPTKPQWVDVWGWSESDTVKAMIQSDILLNGFNPMTPAAIKGFLGQGYVPKDWNRFAYISIEPPPWAIWTFFGTLIIVIGALWVFNFVNSLHKDS